MCLAHCMKQWGKWALNRDADCISIQPVCSFLLPCACWSSSAFLASIATESKAWHILWPLFLEKARAVSAERWAWRGEDTNLCLDLHLNFTQCCMLLKGIYQVLTLSNTQRKTTEGKQYFSLFLSRLIRRSSVRSMTATSNLSLTLSSWHTHWTGCLPKPFSKLSVNVYENVLDFRNNVVS